MKKSLFLSVVLLVFTGPAFSQDQDTARQSVINIAERQLHAFIDPIPDNQVADYGFLTKSEYKKIKLGDPVPVYTLEDSVMVFTQTWRVPIVVDQEYRSFLTVAIIGNVMQATDFGAMELAREFGRRKTGRTIGMLRSYILHTDYLMEKGAGNELEFSPLIEPH